MGASVSALVLGSIAGFSFLNNKKATVIKDIEAQSAGSWVSGNDTSTVAIHAAVVPSGKIFYFAGSGYHASHITGPFEARLLDPTSGSESDVPMPEDLFCAGHSGLPNGNILIAGGTLRYDISPDNCNGKWHGLAAAYEFDWSSETLIKVPSMRHGRWYPTCVTMPDGNVMVTAGYDEYGDHNRLVEIYDSSARTWTIRQVTSGGSSYTVGSSAAGTCGGAGQQTYAGATPNLFLYPRMHLMPSGNIVVAGMLDDIRLWNRSTGAISTLGLSSPFYRHYGTSVLLPLANTSSENGKILIVGGSPGAAEPATTQCQILDFNSGNPSIRNVGSLQYGRKYLAPVILPDGKVVVFGGAAQGNTNPRFVPEMFDPVTESWISLPPANVPRVYHQVSLLLPDGSVWTAGSTPARNVSELRTEFFRPSYFGVTRPTISGPPDVGDYGSSITIPTPNASSITRASLVRLPNTTHHYDANMRCVMLNVQSRTSNSVTVEAPINANLAPPGYYYIHILNGADIPSTSRIIRIPGSRTGSGGGGGSSGEIFYNVPYPGNAVGALSAVGNTRYGEEATNSSSVLVGKSLTSWRLHMRRVGISLGLVRAVVRRSSDDAVVATFNESFDASTLPTSFAERTFTLATPYVIQAGDRILIEFNGSGRVELSVWTTDQIDGPNTRRVRFDGTFYGTASSHDVVGIMSSVGSTGGGNGSTGTVFYYVQSPGGANGSLYAGANTRYGEEVRAASVLIGKTLRTWTVRLRRTSSASGMVRAVVRNSEDAIVATFNGSFDASTLSTSYTDRTFTLTAPHTIQAGDKILVEYSGPAGIEVEATTADAIDGSNTRRTRYDGVAYIGANTVDIVGKMSD